MTWDLYLILKTTGIAVFIFAGGIFAAKTLGISRSKAYFINTLAVLCGFVGNRLWYIIQHVYGHEKYEYHSLTQVWPAFKNAGSVLYGWVLGGTLAIILLCRIFKLRPLKYLDAVSPWLLIAQALNRFGCFDAGCCYGKPAKLSKIFYNYHVNGPAYPVQLYEALWDLFLFAIIWPNRKKPGFATYSYFIGYAIIRFFMEFYRGDNKPAFYFMTVPQATSVLIIFLAAIFWIFSRPRSTS